MLTINRIKLVRKKEFEATNFNLKKDIFIVYKVNFVNYNLNMD